MEQADGTPKDGVADFFIYCFYHIWTTQCLSSCSQTWRHLSQAVILCVCVHGCFLCLAIQNVSSLRASPPHTVYLTFMICLLHFPRIVNNRRWKGKIGFTEHWIHSAPSVFCNPPPFSCFQWFILRLPYRRLVYRHCHREALQHLKSRLLHGKKLESPRGNGWQFNVSKVAHWTLIGRPCWVFAAILR